MSQALVLKFLVMTGTIGLNLIGIATLNASQVLAQTSAAKVGTPKTFSCRDSEAIIKNTQPIGVTIGTASFYIGYQQVSSINKDPIVIRFDRGVKTWCKTDYETTNDDGSGYGLIWDGNLNFYAVFSSTGTQTGNNFTRFARNGWLTNYGVGGGSKVAILTKINPADGNITHATFIIAKKKDGKTNTLNITGLSFSGGGVKINGEAWFSPLRPDRSTMTCTGSSPFNYTATFSADLKTALATSVATTPSGRCD